MFFRVVFFCCNLGLASVATVTILVFGHAIVLKHFVELSKRHIEIPSKPVQFFARELDLRPFGGARNSAREV